MLFLLCHLITEFFLPRLGEMAWAMLTPIMVIVITLAGITMLFGAVGMKISTNLGSTIVSAIFGAVAFIGISFVKFLSWLVQRLTTVAVVTFEKSQHKFLSMGLNSIVSTILAFLTSTLVVVVIL